MIGSFVSNKGFQDQNLAHAFIQKSMGNLSNELNLCTQQQNTKGLITTIRLIVDFLRGFTSRVNNDQVRQVFWEQLQQIYKLVQMPGLASIPMLQEQVTKYVERQITILGVETKPLIVEWVNIQTQSITNVNDGQIEKLESLISVVSNYLGQIREEALEVIEELFSIIFLKIQQIPVPEQDTSEIEKIQIRVTRVFFLLLSKTFNDFTCSILLSPRNYQLIDSFISLIFDHQLRGVDQTTKKIISTMMRAM